MGRGKHQQDDGPGANWRAEGFSRPWSNDGFHGRPSKWCQHRGCIGQARGAVHKLRMLLLDWWHRRWCDRWRTGQGNTNCFGSLSLTHYFFSNRTCPITIAKSSIVVTSVWTLTTLKTIQTCHTASIWTKTKTDRAHSTARQIQSPTPGTFASVTPDLRRTLQLLSKTAPWVLMFFISSRHHNRFLHRAMPRQTPCTASTVWMSNIALIMGVDRSIRVNNATNSSTVMRRTSAAESTQTATHMTITSESVVKQVKAPIIYYSRLKLWI